MPVLFFLWETVQSVQFYVFFFFFFSFNEGKGAYSNISCKSKEKMEQGLSYKQIEWRCYKNYLRNMPTHSHVTKDVPSFILIL